MLIDPIRLNVLDLFDDLYLLFLSNMVMRVCRLSLRVLRMIPVLNSCLTDLIDKLMHVKKTNMSLDLFVVYAN